jgi:L-fuculose-phosphate aldolase
MQSYMSERQARRDICDVGQKMYDKGFVAANDGNISVRLTDDVIMVTPTAISKGEMDPDAMVTMNLDGEILSGKSRPSSEVKMHIAVYRQSKDIRSVVHAHPPISTAFAVARRPLDKPIISEAIMGLGVVPVAQYAKPGTKEVPDSVIPYVKDYNAVLLANHGLLTWGEDITQAFFRMEAAEHYAKILYHLEKIGEPQELNCAEVNELLKIRENLGVTTGGQPPCKLGDAGSIDAEQIAKMVTIEVMKALNLK